MTKRNGFVLFHESRPLVEQLTLDQRGTLLTAVFAYDAGDPLPEMDAVTRIVFLDIKGRLDKAASAYEAVCEKRRDAANKRWTDANACKSMQKDANASFAMQSIVNKKEKETEIETETEKDSKKEKPKSFRELFNDSQSLLQDFVEDAWRDWLEVRKRKNVPWTARAAVLNANTLKKLSGGDPIKAVKILEQSTENGWQGLFELKGTQTKKSKINWEVI